MYMDLIRLVRRAIEEARSGGRDYLGQSEFAVRTVLSVRPDMTASDAVKAVDVIRTA
jgi:hypothetical protein